MRWTLRAGLALIVALSPAVTLAADPAPPAAAPAASGPLTIDEAVQSVRTFSHRISPSGRWVAYLRRQDKTPVLEVMDLQHDGARTGVALPGEWKVDWVEWANDDRLLVSVTMTFWIDHKATFVQQEHRGNASVPVPVRRIIAMDRSGQKQVALMGDVKAQDLGSVNNFLRRDPQHIVVQVRTLEGLVDLYKVDVDSGRSERIAHGNELTRVWFTDIDGKPAFRLDEAWIGHSINIYAVSGYEGDGTPRWKKVASIDPRDEQRDAAPDFYPLVPGPDPGTYYVAARKPGADTTGLYLYDFIKDEYVRTLKEKDGIDVEAVLVRLDTLEYLGAVWYADRLKIEFADPALQTHFDALDRFFGSEVDIGIRGAGSGGDSWLLYANGPRDRGSFYVYDLKARKIEPVGSRYPFLDEQRLGRTEVVRYPARDGRTIMGYLTRPPGAVPGKPTPFVMMPHGGPQARDRYHFDDLVQLLATRGYTVFQPNFRGSSGFGKAFAEAGYGEWGGAMQNDLDDGFAYLVSAGIADPKRACIVGWSYGGYAALAAAALTPQLYRCAVSIAGVSDLEAFLKSDQRKFSDDPKGWEFMKKELGDPAKDREKRLAHSPLRHVDAIQVPVLLAHGERDARVPFEQSVNLEKALREAGKPVQFVTDDKAGHGWETPDQSRKLFGAVLEFLDRNLPTRPGPEGDPPAAPAAAKD